VTGLNFGPPVTAWSPPIGGYGVRLIRLWLFSSDRVSKIFSRPIFASLGLEGFTSRLGLGIEDYRSRSQANFLETSNTARIWLSKTSVIQRVFSLLYLHVKNTENRSENARNSKKFN